VQRVLHKTGRGSEEELCCSCFQNQLGNPQRTPATHSNLAQQPDASSSEGDTGGGGLYAMTSF